jgi:hypothetical protein
MPCKQLNDFLRLNDGKSGERFHLVASDVSIKRCNKKLDFIQFGGIAYMRNERSVYYGEFSRVFDIDKYNMSLRTVRKPTDCRKVKISAKTIQRTNSYGDINYGELAVKSGLLSWTKKSRIAIWGHHRPIIMNTMILYFDFTQVSQEQNFFFNLLLSKRAEWEYATLKNKAEWDQVQTATSAISGYNSKIPKKEYFSTKGLNLREVENKNFKGFLSPRNPILILKVAAAKNFFETGKLFDGEFSICPS